MTIPTAGPHVNALEENAAVLRDCPQTPSENARRNAEGLLNRGGVVLPRAEDGHYYATVRINNVPLRTVLDTGATKIALSRSDARKVGINIADDAYTSSGLGIAGSVRTAQITLPKIELGSIKLSDVTAVVFNSDAGPSLLGMSFINRLQELQISNRTATLRY